MAMGKRTWRTRQASMWVATQDLPRSAAHPCYRRLNRVLDEAQFDAFVEGACATFYAEVMGRPSLAPGRYVRPLLLGYFEGLDSERAIAWRAADSLSVRSFLDLDLHEPAPDHSTISRTRRLIDLETHRAVFTWVLRQLADAGLVKGTTIGIDATILEANAAFRLTSGGGRTRRLLRHRITSNWQNGYQLYRGAFSCRSTITLWPVRSSAGLCAAS